MFTTYQVGLIKEVTQYQSECSGVYYRNNIFKHWGAIFHIKGFEEHLGYFETEEEATQVYKDYREKYYQKILTQVEKEKEEVYGSSNTAKN